MRCPKPKLWYESAKHETVALRTVLQKHNNTESQPEIITSPKEKRLRLIKRPISSSSFSACASSPSMLPYKQPRVWSVDIILSQTNCCTAIDRVPVALFRTRMRLVQSHIAIVEDFNTSEWFCISGCFQRRVAVALNFTVVPCCSLAHIKQMNTYSCHSTARFSYSCRSELLLNLCRNEIDTQEVSTLQCLVSFL